MTIKLVALVLLCLMSGTVMAQEPKVAAFPSVCHVAVAGNAFRCVPAVWDY